MWASFHHHIRQHKRERLYTRAGKPQVDFFAGSCATAHRLYTRAGASCAGRRGHGMKGAALSACMTLLLSGCGGSGSNVRQPATVPPPPTSPPPAAKSEEQLRAEYAAHPEFRGQPALAVVKAHYAYARGATGKGVTVGIVDSGVDGAHPELAGKLSPDSYPTWTYCTTPLDSNARASRPSAVISGS